MSAETAISYIYLRPLETRGGNACSSPVPSQLNDKFGLPPIGLPPKKWFGASDDETVDMRHKMLLAYINDCLKRPVLIHSKELQNFVDMPQDVCDAVSKGR